MHIDIFKDIRTVDDLKNIMGCLRGVASEHFVSENALLEIQGTDYEGLRYMFTSTRNGVILYNWFTYKSGALLGLLRSEACSTELVLVSEPMYIKYITLHANCWLSLREDSNYDFYIGGKLAMTDIVRYDVLKLSDFLVFLQLDTTESRYFVCLDITNPNKGVYIPNNLDEFNSYFSKTIRRYASSGVFGDTTITDLSLIYDDICTTIFSSAFFEPLKPLCDIENVLTASIKTNKIA